MQKLTVKNLRIEYLRQPLGIDMLHPRFSWELESTEPDTMQASYAITVRDGEDIVWRSEEISEGSVGIEYDGKALVSRKRYAWTIEITDNHGNIAIAESWFEMGLFPTDWQAQWIEPDLPPAQEEKSQNLLMQVLRGNKGQRLPEERLRGSSFLRKECTIQKTVKRARAYATAHGIYQLFINGKQVGDRLFAPEFSAYQKVLYYQTYDVTDFLVPGTNAFGAIIADGYYVGRIGMSGESCQYGNKHALLLQLEVEYEDGTKGLILSDSGFKSSTGPFIYSDFFIGEKYDATKELSGWDQVGYSDAHWKGVKPLHYGYAILAAQMHESIKRGENIPAQRVIKTPKGETVIDFGQVLAGRVRMKVSGQVGTEIKIEHSEILDEAGNFINNIIGRNKDHVDFYICKGGDKVFEPTFTFHGFRYARISGYPGEVKTADFSAVVIVSGMELTGRFECSNADLNQLQHNLYWSQIANMISIPTDCPQRERAGWTGDIQIFSPTASFNLGIDAFLTSWMRNLRAEQREDGQVPIVIPYAKGYQGLSNFVGSHTSAAWGDACLKVPFVLHQKYSDVRILSDNYEAMEKYVGYIKMRAEKHDPISVKLSLASRFNKRKWELRKYLWNTGFHFGDWLIPSKTTSSPISWFIGALRTKNLVASAYFAYSTRLLSEISGLLGKADKEKEYAALNEKVREAFAAWYMKKDGTMTNDIQGAYVLALAFNLVPDIMRETVLNRLVEKIEKNGNRLDTGFASVGFLLDVLFNNGRKDLAYKLLYQDQCPSWLYEVKHGATTMWETWGAITPEGKVRNGSYNHYAFGCVGDWMYRVIGGLNVLEPGYKRILIKPQPDANLTSAKTELKSMYGQISVEWKREGGKFLLDVSIPPNTTAIVEMPNGGRHEIGSGKYSFQEKETPK